MRTWTTETWVPGAPIPFELLGLDGERLLAGTRAGSAAS